MTRAYYNEIDPYAAQWLRNLIAAGHIAPGDVDERSIIEVQPRELQGYTQCHFFAGIGVWSHALRSAGWADDRPVWTGSCPCQPFSAAGKGDEFGDERHLWPVWFRLIRECRPVVVLGEQVASKDALAWLDHVSTDLEGEGYTFGAVDTCAAGFGAPHIRQRLYFVADASDSGYRSERDGAAGRGEPVGDCILGHAQGRGLGIERDAPQPRRSGHADGAEQHGGVGDSEIIGREVRSIRTDGDSPHGTEETGQPSDALGHASREGQQGREQRAPCNDDRGGAGSTWTS